MFFCLRQSQHILRVSLRGGFQHLRQSRATSLHEVRADKITPGATFQSHPQIHLRQRGGGGSAESEHDDGPEEKISSQEKIQQRVSQEAGHVRDSLQCRGSGRKWRGSIPNMKLLKKGFKFFFNLEIQVVSMVVSIKPVYCN